MTELEIKIIDILKDNARLASHKIATLVESTETDVEKVIQSLEDQGIIAGYSLLINDHLLDRKEPIQAWVELSVSPEKKTGYDAVAKRLYNYPNIRGLYLLSGQYDFLVIVEGDSHKEIAAFVFDKLATQHNITSTNTHFVFKKYKELGVVLDQEDSPDRLAILA